LRNSSILALVTVGKRIEKFGNVIERRRKVDPKGDIWRSVIQTTCQAARMSNAQSDALAQFRSKRATIQ
jgi:hypothetical protein